MNVTFILFQVGLNSIVSAAILALTAIGFTIIFGIMKVVNFAHGAFYAMGAYLMYLALTAFHLPFALALLLVCIAVVLIGMGVEWLLLRDSRGDQEVSLIATIALTLVIVNSLLVIFGPSPLHVPAPVDGTLQIASAFVPKVRVYIIVAALILLVVLYLLIKHTRQGRALRAAVSDFQTAAVQGINPELYYPLGFGLGVGLAALAGALTAPIFQATPYMGDRPLVMSFVIVILGGLGSIPGLLLASALVGCVINVVGFFAGGTMAEMILFAMVIVIMLIRPSGLIGKGDI